MFKVFFKNIQLFYIAALVILITLSAYSVTAKPHNYFYEKSTYQEQYSSDYQLFWTEDHKGFVVYRDGFLVGYVPLDKKCNLTKLIDMDND